MKCPVAEVDRLIRQRRDGRAPLAVPLDVYLAAELMLTEAGHLLIGSADLANAGHRNVLFRGVFIYLADPPPENPR